ncbi:CIA30 family protein [Sorangium sp. So ce134]
MKTRIFLHGLNLAVCGLAVAAFAACGDDGDGGAGGGTSSATSGTVSPSTTSTGTTDPTTSSSSTSASASSSATTGAGGGPQTLEIIDDMEDEDNAIRASGGRIGYWYTFNDGTEGATQNPPPDPEGTGETPFTMSAIEPARGQSAYAARSWGSGFEGWGVGFGFDLNSPEGTKTPYDASAYTGITFWAKVGAGSSTAATVMISDPSTDPAGGSCTDECDNWQKSLAGISEEWQQFTIPFADLKQGGWGTPATTDQIDATKLYSIQFQVSEAATFDIYIDDLAFYN